MDGVDDKLKLQTTTGKIFNIVELDATILMKEDWHQFLNFGGEYINFQSNTNNLVFTAGFQSVYVNGVQVTSGTPFLSVGQRFIIKAVLKEGITTDTCTFFTNTVSQFVYGNIYDIKLYQIDIIKAHIDTSTGTVLDQSGNGNHATLTGGTWVDDNVGGDDNTALTFVENITISGSPSTVPLNITIISIDHTKISDEIGINESRIVFTFDQDVTNWTVNVLGASHDTGTIADSGGSVSANTQITAIISWTELYQEGENRVNIYGQNNIGWTPYG